MTAVDTDECADTSVVPDIDDQDEFAVPVCTQEYDNSYTLDSDERGEYIEICATNDIWQSASSPSSS